MLKTGIEHESEMTVSASNTAAAVGSGDMDVLATPAMIALMENAAMLCVAPFLSDGQTTVGSQISSTHLKPTPSGGKVKAVAKLIEIDGRKLVFDVRAADEQGVIGSGTHTRYIVDREKFMGKLK